MTLCFVFLVIGMSRAHARYDAMIREYNTQYSKYTSVMTKIYKFTVVDSLMIKEAQIYTIRI